MLKVTDDHIVHFIRVDGQDIVSKPAREVKVGDSMIILDTSKVLKGGNIDIS